MTMPLSRASKGECRAEPEQPPENERTGGRAAPLLALSAAAYPAWEGAWAGGQPGGRCPGLALSRIPFSGIRGQWKLSYLLSCLQAVWISSLQQNRLYFF